MSQRQKKKEKRQSNQEEISGFLICYQYYLSFFFILTGMHTEGEKKERQKLNFFLLLKMAEIQVGGIGKPRNKKKKA